MKGILESINEARNRKALSVELGTDEDVYHILNALYCEYGKMKSEGDTTYLKSYEDVYSNVCKAAKNAGIALDPDYDKPLSKIRI